MEEQIEKTIREIIKLSKAKMDKNLSSDITPAQNCVLVYIYKQKTLYNRETKQKDVEKEFNIKASSVNSLITNLINTNYINKKTSKDDKRINYLYLTEKGESYINYGKKVIEDTEKIMLENISKEEIIKFFEILTKIKNNLEKY